MYLTEVEIKQKLIHFFSLLISFKETFKSFFPDVYTVMQHRQVVLLICGLMSDPSPIILLVYERWIRDGQKSAGKTLIEAMFCEAGLPVPEDLLHNQWINYYNHSEGLIKDTTPVYVPSRWYWFYCMKANISCNIQHGKLETPECSMSIISSHRTKTKDLLSLCHRICQHQAVRNLYLLNVRREYRATMAEENLIGC